MADKIKVRNKKGQTKYFDAEAWKILKGKDTNGWEEVPQTSNTVSTKVARVAPPSGDKVPSVVVNKADEAKKAAEEAAKLAQAEAEEARNNAILDATAVGVEVNDEMSTEDILKAIEAKKAELDEVKLNPEFAAAVKAAGITRGQIKDYFDGLEPAVKYSNSSNLDSLIEKLNEVLAGDIAKLNLAFGLTAANDGGL